MSHRFGPDRLAALTLMLSATWASVVNAQGVTSQGNTGGLVIPSAHVLAQGSLALSYGDVQEPQLGSYATKQNMSLGIGLLPNFELFGRYSNYINPSLNGSVLVNGVRDLSANAKLQIPLPWAGGPKLAVGANDIAGGAVFFSSRYLVASQQFGPLGASIGYARGSGIRSSTFGGVFGGLDLRMGDTGLSALAEHDGQQKHAGLRWQSAPLAALGQAQLVGSVKRSFGAVTPTGLEADSTRLTLSLVMPLGDTAGRQAAAQIPPSQALPALDAAPAAGVMPASTEDRLASLYRALVATGLERVRIGQRDSLLGSVLAIEYENRRYGTNESDALGIVLGLGAELAPAGTQRVQAVTLKDGLRLYETSVGVAVYRAYLRDGPIGHVRDSLNVERLPPDLSGQTRWAGTGSSPASRVRIEIKPDLNFTLGTEWGSFDYALAANVQAIAPLWSGAQVYSSTIVPLAHTSNLDDGAVYAINRQRSGLKTLAIRQNFWLGDKLLTSAAAGRFHHETLGVQAESALFLPGADHLLRLRAAAYDKPPGGLAGQDRAIAATYRHRLSPSMWLEAGMQRYTDGSHGPSLEWNRWFGDVAVQVYYRRGADRQFAGLQFSLPLTPRQGMAPGPVIFTGASQYAQGIRTRITTASQPANLVQPQAVRDLRLETSLDNDLLNAGRAGQRYFHLQVPRMREAFFIFARDQLPESSPLTAPAASMHAPEK
jgi:hypothetical protein